MLASVADSQGRTLTEPQGAARQAYRLALQEECLRAGHRFTAGVGDMPALYSIMVATNLRRLSAKDLSLVAGGLEAEQESRPVSPCEAAALQTIRCDWERLREMVAVGSTTLYR